MTVFISEQSWFGDEGQSPVAAVPARAEHVDSQELQYISHPTWGGGQRHFEASETNRLNEAHWRRARDGEINLWLAEQLATLRTRATYEVRNDPSVAGVVKTLVDDVVGPSGPTLQVVSDDDAYSDAAEKVWNEWFSAPTFRPNFSGADLLRLWVRNLPRCGEFLSLIRTDMDSDSLVQMRLQPINPRRLGNPGIYSENMTLGVEMDEFDRPIRYWVAENGKYSTTYSPWPTDLVIHEFSIDEEGQARGFPWLTPSLPTSADLRDYDVQVMDAARSNADSYGMLYTRHPDAPVWTAPEQMHVQRRTMKMAPPGWEPWASPATMPPVQYPDFRSEKQRDSGRPLNMPLLMVRLDSSNHNYSSARLDTQSWGRTVQGVQNWIGGTPTSYGTLNRLCDLILAEARFNVPQLRRKPKDVNYLWMWPPRPHVDPTKEGDAETIGLENRTVSFPQALQARGVPMDIHMKSLERTERAFENSKYKPKWLTGETNAAGAEGRESRADKAAAEDGKPATKATKKETASAK